MNSEVKHMLYASCGNFGPVKNHLLIKAIYFPQYILTNLNEILEQLVRNLSIYNFLIFLYDNFWYF